MRGNTRKPHRKVLRNKSYDDMIYAYDFQTRVSQMFAKYHKISSFVEPKRGEFMELEEYERDPSEVLVNGCSVISSVDEKMNLFDDCNIVPLSPGPILSEAELELEFFLSSPFASLSAGINLPGLDEYFPSPISSYSSSPLEYDALSQSVLSFRSYTNAMVMDQQLVHEYTSCPVEEVDLLYKKYAEKMSWLDAFNHEKLSTLSEFLLILNHILFLKNL